MPTTQTFVVIRPSEKTVALVTLKLEGAVQDPMTGKTKLIAACTKWVSKTKEGKHAWEVESSEDFNVGDLVDYQTSQELKPFLEEQGIMSLEIKTVCGVELNWEYDDHLVDESEIEREE